MAITFVNSGTFASGTGTVAPGLPSGWQADDVHILVVESHGNDGDPGAISGWTRINGVYNAGGGTDRAGVTVYRRVAVGGDSAPTVPDSGNHTSARIHGFRGVDTSTPEDATAVTTANNSNSTSLSITGISTATDGAMVLYCVAHGDDVATWSGLGGHNLASITDVADSHTAGNDGTNHCAYGILTSLGASGTLTGTIGVSEHTAAVTIALRPLVAAFTPDLQGWRFYDNDGGEAASTALELDDTNTDVDVSAGNVDLQLRIMVQETAGVSGLSTDDYQLQVSHEGGGYNNVTGASTYVIATTAGLTNDNATTNRAGSPLADGTGTFVAGEQSSDGLIDNVQLTASNFTEHVFGLRVVAADVAYLDTLDFQLSSPTGIVNTVTPRITVSKDDAVLANDVESLSEVSIPALAGEHTLLANDVESLSELTKPALAEVHVLLANDVESLSEVTVPALAGEHTLLANDVESLSEVTVPALAGEHTLLANDVESLSEVTKPAAAVVHNLLADDVESTTKVDSPLQVCDNSGADLVIDGANSVYDTLTGPRLTDFTADVLLANDVESLSEVTKPAVGQEHALLADDVESNSEVTVPTLAGEHTLLADDVESLSEVTIPALAGEHTLLANDVESNSEVSVPALAGEHTLLADDVESNSEVSIPALAGEHALLADDTESASEVTKPVLTVIHNVLAENIESTSELTKPTLVDVSVGTDALLADDVESLSEVSQPALDDGTSQSSGGGVYQQVFRRRRGRGRASSGGR